MALYTQDCVDKNCVVPQRYMVAFLIFISGIHAYLMRVNLSVALLEMTRKLKNETEAKDSCPYEKIEKITKESSESFDWSEEQQGWILSAFFIGYFITHLPGGVYAETYGGKHMLGTTMVICAVCTIITPPLTIAGSFDALFTLRVIIGMTQGTMFPAMTCIMSHWIPKRERATLGALSYSGVQMGSVLGNACTGVVLEKKGWPFTFYMYGVLALTWYIFYVIFVYSSPAHSPFITTQEREYLNAELVPPQHGLIIPWRKILTSAPVWSIITCHFGHAWGFFSMITLLPKYMNSILHVSIKDSGLYSSLPYLVMWIVSMVSAVICDWLVHHNIMTLIFARKFFTTIAQVGPAVFILAAVYSGCNVALVVCLFILAMATMGTYYAGVRVNCLDLAPNYSGVVMAIVSGMGSLAGIISPSLCGFITRDGTFAGWKNYFWINFGILVGTNLAFLMFGSADIQPWNNQ